ncbi:MAG: magnesium transporter CorA family protein [Bacteroidales bacterium]|nr:magnesium transporter CorA family protein [Bacteroidales bacterium]MBK8883978.1 magnesium transporter CorA family protein [Bacteroidales bacterium]
MSESKFYHFTSTGLFYGLASAREAIDAMREGGFVWLNYYKPSREEISSLVDSIGIHPLSVEDCFDDKQVPKIEYFNNNTFILFNAFSYAEKELSIDEVNLFIGEKFLITISGYQSGDRKPLSDIVSIIENDPSNAKAGPGFLMHIVLDHLVDEKYRAFDNMEDDLEEAEELLINELEKFQPRQLIHLRKDLLALRKSLYHEREILVKICRSDCPYVPEKAIVHYRDVYDHLSKFFELTETYREIETSLMELYTSLISNRMNQMSNETNISMKRLTLIATICMPLTLIAGIGGMSEWSMITGPENWRVSYPLFLLGMLILALLSYFIIKRLEKRKED